MPTAATTPVGGAQASGERPGRDQSGTCQITVPASFVGDVGYWRDADASIILSAETIASGTFAAYTAKIPENVSNSPAIREYRQGSVDQTADTYSLQYTTAANPDDVLYRKNTTGLYVARLFDGTSVCSLLILYPSDAEGTYRPKREAVVNSLRKVQR